MIGYSHSAKGFACVLHMRRTRYGTWHATAAAKALAMKERCNRCKRIRWCSTLPNNALLPPPRKTQARTRYGKLSESTLAGPAAACVRAQGAQRGCAAPAAPTRHTEPIYMSTATHIYACMQRTVCAHPLPDIGHIIWHGSGPGPPQRKARPHACCEPMPSRCTRAAAEC